MTMSALAQYAINSQITADAQSAHARYSSKTPQSSNSVSPQKSAAIEIEDKISLSPAAMALSAANSRSVEYYEQFFPTRDGYSATALAATIVDPGIETFSEGKSATEVAQAARDSLDSAYKQMKAEGEPFDYNSFEGKDWYSAMGNLDRRALSAVANNSQGLFSKQEQDIAQSIMTGQQGWAMGLPNGPTRLVKGLPDAFGGDHTARMKAAANWLDKASTDEKTTIEWASQRASVEISYEWITGQPAQDMRSENPLVQLIKSAMDTMKDNPERGRSTGIIRDKQDLSQQPWFAGFEDRLDTAIRNTEEYYRDMDA